MIAAAILVDPRGAAKLAPDHHGAIAVEPPFFQVVEQGRQPAVEQREMIAGVFEIRAVRPTVPIPSPVGNRHHPGPHLDEPAGGEKVIIQNRPGVAVACGLGRAPGVAGPHAGIFPLEIERFDQFAAGQNAKGLLVVGIGPGQHPRVGQFLQAVNLLQQRLPGLQRRPGDSLELQLGGIGVGSEGSMGLTAEPGLTQVAPGRGLHPGGQADEGRDSRLAGPQQLGSHRPQRRPAPGGLPGDGVPGQALKRGVSPFRPNQ